MTNLIKQHCDVVFHDEALDGWGSKSLGDHVSKQLQKWVIKPTSVQQRDRLPVFLERSLVYKCTKLLQGAHPPRVRDKNACWCQVKIQKREQLIVSERARCRAYASLASNILAMRSDIVSVTSSSPITSPKKCGCCNRIFGAQPLTLPPWDITARATCVVV